MKGFALVDVSSFLSVVVLLVTNVFSFRPKIRSAHEQQQQQRSFLQCSQTSMKYVYHYKNHYFDIVDYFSQDQSRACGLVEMLLSSLGYSTKSQAKKACRMGAVLIFRQTMNDMDGQHQGRSQNINSYFTKNFHHGIVGEPNSMVNPGDIVAIQTRLPDQFYPVSVTKYILPPTVPGSGVKVLYQDNHLALVQKPENMTTIGGRGARDDLQSVLGFLLRPPSGSEPSYHPRPVHRLDRRTSGLVLIAKTQASMRFLSQAFAIHNVTKIYTALVFGNVSDAHAKPSWQTIDYPIDGRPAVSEWRLGSSSEDHFISLVQVKPHTGKTHQIRRHLAYCAGLPIIGDAKYDKGARHLRTNGMYLCCHSLEFPHPSKEDVVQVPSTHNDESAIDILDGGSRMRVTISLPRKFHQRMRQSQPLQDSADLFINTSTSQNL